MGSNYVRVVGQDEMILISSFAEAEFRELGAEWIEQLVKKSSHQDRMTSNNR